MDQDLLTELVEQLDDEAEPDDFGPSSKYSENFHAVVLSRVFAHFLNHRLPCWRLVPSFFSKAVRSHAAITNKLVIRQDFSFPCKCLAGDLEQVVLVDRLTGDVPQTAEARVLREDPL